MDIGIKDGQKIDILGTKWTIKIVKFKESETLKNNDAAGRANPYSKTITISDCSDKKTLTDVEKVERFKHVLRHEIVHAFLSESGLRGCSRTSVGPWAKNEEMVDWMAAQSIKIFKVFEKLNILE